MRSVENIARRHSTTVRHAGLFTYLFSLMLVVHLCWLSEHASNCVQVSISGQVFSVFIHVVLLFYYNMRVAIFRHGCASEGFVLEIESLEDLKQQAGRYLDITVGVIFNDVGAPIHDVRLITPSSIVYVDEADVVDFRRGHYANDQRRRNIRQQRSRLEDLLQRFLRSSSPSPDRDRIEDAVQQVLRYMASQFGIYALVSGVEGKGVKRACADDSELAQDSKLIVDDMMSLIAEYNDASDSVFKEQVQNWIRDVRPRNA